MGIAIMAGIAAQGGVTGTRSRCYDTAAPRESGIWLRLTGATGTHG